MCTLPACDILTVTITSFSASKQLLMEYAVKDRELLVVAAVPMIIS